MKLEKALIDLYKKTATSIPEDVESSLKAALKREKKNSLAHYTLSNILENIKLAKNSELPMCQDTGVPMFYIKVPIGTSHHKITQNIINATRIATKEIPLRPNAVNILNENNTDNNLGFNKNKAELQQPIIHFEQWNKPNIEIKLMLKGGGSENIGQQYKLPNKELKADRNIEGIKKCIIDAVFKAQGKGCPPYIVGVAIGGSKDLISKESKKQLLRKIDDKNKDKKINNLENELKQEINSLGIGPLGLGGKTTVLAVKIKALHRHPASFFVEISFMCWAARRKTLIYKGDLD